MAEKSIQNFFKKRMTMSVSSSTATKTTTIPPVIETKTSPSRLKKVLSPKILLGKDLKGALEIIQSDVNLTKLFSAILPLN